MKKTIASLLCASTLAMFSLQSTAHANVFEEDTGWVDPCAGVRKALGSESKSDHENSWRKEVIKYAKEGIEGTKYSQSNRWEWQKSADCSSYVAMVYEKALGIKPSEFGESTMAQCKKLKKIDKEDAKEGDLAMWGDGDSSHHVAIYNGDGKVYEMKDEQYNGKLSSLKGYYGGQPTAFYTIEGTSFGDKAIDKFDKEAQSSDDGKSNETVSDKEGKGGSRQIGSFVVKDFDNKVKKCYDYMHGKFGLSSAAIAGILGNWTRESSIEPRTIEGIYGRIPSDSECESAAGNANLGIGLGQWTFDRHTSLIDFAKKRHDDKIKAFTLPVQLEFMFNGDGGNVGILKQYALSASSDPKNNAETFQSQWERSADGAANIAQRAACAEAIYDYMKSHGMDGEADHGKINKMKNGGFVSAAFSPTVATGGSTMSDRCGVDKKKGGLDDADFGGGWTQPIKGFKGTFNSEQDFGPCASRQGNWHDGLDYGSMGFGDDKNIYAVHSGKIKTVKMMGSGLGYYVVLDAGKREVAYQEFTNNRSDIFVDEGDNVKAGQKIARLDSKGGMGGVGTHLHLGITKEGGDAVKGLSHAFSDDGYWVDPMKVLGKPK